MMLWKDALRDIRKSLGRFISIILISALGVAFYAGIKASIPDMKYSADSYYDDNNLFDLRIVSALGLTQEDADEIAKLEGVEDVFATHFKDVLAQKEGAQYTMRMHGISETMNQAVLIEGRMPQKSGECVVEYHTLKTSPFVIGDTIAVKSKDASNLSEELQTQEFTVVGYVQTPYYLSYEKGSASVGGGTIDYYMMIPQSDFIGDVYHEINVTIEGAKAENSYEDAYFDVIQPVSQRISDLGIGQSEKRKQDVEQQMEEVFAEKEKQLQEAKDTFAKEIAEKEQSIKDGKTQLQQKETQFAIEQALAKDKITEGTQQLSESKTQLALLQSQYDAANTYASEVKESITQQMKDWDEQIVALQEEITRQEQELKETKQRLEEEDLTEWERMYLEEKVKTLEKTLELEKQSVASYEPLKAMLQKQLDQAYAQVASLQVMIDQANQEIANGEQQLLVAQEQLETQSASATTQLAQARVELETGEKQLEEGKKQGEAEFLKQEELLQKAKQDQQLQDGSWYVLDRNSHYAYMDYLSVTQRMEGIAKIFPVFFFLVAALVCLTTMTRMVDEQRGVIGTYKALGYDKGAIACKFLLYAFLASMIGSVFGCTLGMYIFPSVIFSAWNIMYTVPKLEYVMQTGLAIRASLVVVLITVCASWLAVYKELYETPALLMRPKAPKAGKTILLERISFIWNRLSFTMKVTMRNLFRYKKRFFMTVIGISGCSALLLAGFGIQDSISQVPQKQYEEIFSFDAQLNVKDDATEARKQEIASQLENSDAIRDTLALRMEYASITHKQSEQTITMMIPSEVSVFKDYVHLQKRTTKEEVALTSNGALISEKLAQLLGCESDDVIEIKDENGITREIKIAGIVEQYVGHMLYMTPSYYQQVFQISPIDNTWLIHLHEQTTQSEDALKQQFVGQDSVQSLSFYAGIAETFEETIASLNIVVIVLVVCAALLAFVVLYNLTNVNIAERIKEIATIKVLGFYPKEVSSYVFKENIFLSMIGGAVGLMIGTFLHQLIMRLAEMDQVMFGRNIDLSSYALAFLLTMLFTCIINALMVKKLKAIPMVESLKSIE